MRKIEIRFYKGDKYYCIKDFTQPELLIRNSEGSEIRVSDEQIYGALDNLFKETYVKQLLEKKD